MKTAQQHCYSCHRQNSHFIHHAKVEVTGDDGETYVLKMSMTVCTSCIITVSTAWLEEKK